MKRTIALLAAVLCAFGLSAQVLRVGATPVPHAEMLNLVKDDLAAQGVEIEVVEMTDYVVINDATESGELDANFYQHLPYMESTNEEKGYHLVSAGGIHIEPMALYSRKITDIADLRRRATIAIPNDPTNGGRALLLLQSAGLITLRDGAGITATPLDVADNPKRLRFRELDAAAIPRVLPDVDAAVINGNYAIPAGLLATRDGLYIEGADSPYVNVVVVREGNENDPRVTALVQALQSEKVRAYINETYPNGEVVPVF